MSFEVPPFLSTGALNWTRFGFHYPVPPPIDLLSPEALASENPWIVLAATIEHAKVDEHFHARNLKKWFHADPPFGRMCIVAIGAVGTDSDLQMIVTLMEEGSDDACTHACVAAARAGNLWLVPHMLQAWHKVRLIGDHETIGYAISNLLEEELGPIAENAGAATVQLMKSSAKLERLLKMTDRNRSEKFDRLVRSRLTEVQQQLGRDDVPVWGGKLFGVVSFAESMLSRLRRPFGLRGPITFREKFEASTGINCSAFFRDDRFQPLAAAAILEEFLESPQLPRYAEGIRYFFGHQIPD